MSHTQRLREAAKFFTGLVAADFLVGAWMLSAGLLPQTFLGIEVTPAVAGLWMGFDAFLLLVLVHYAWHPEAMEPDISRRSLFLAVGVITGIVAIAHMLRLALGWEVVIGGWEAPMWLSWLGVVIAGYVSYVSFHFASRK